MVNYRLGSTLVLLFILLALAGCAGFMDSLNSGMSGTADFLKASAAEEKGDAAYERRDYAAAFEAYQTAAEAGGRYGQFMLAGMYLAGEGTKRNPKMYLHWMRQAAERDYPAANYLMGRAYLASDSEAALTYFQKAAKQEHGGAMYMLGLMYAGGTGVPQSDREALRWFRMASAQGVAVDNRLLSESGIQAYAEGARRRAEQSQAERPAQQGLVREIQQRLTTLGFEPGPVDGLFGQKTRAAIVAFQRQKGLEPDGRASAQMLEALKNVSP
jgi:TPR repeat protein